MWWSGHTYLHIFHVSGPQHSCQGRLVCMYFESLYHLEAFSHLFTHMLYSSAITSWCGPTRSHASYILAPPHTPAHNPAMWQPRHACSHRYCVTAPPCGRLGTHVSAMSQHCHVLAWALMFRCLPCKCLYMVAWTHFFTSLPRPRAAMC